MANTVDGVESKGEAETELNSTLDSKGKSSERLDERGALNVPAEQGGGEVGGEVCVGGAGQSDAGDTGPGRGAEPRLLDLVDGQMGGDGALLSLSNEDFVTLRRRELVGRDATTRHPAISTLLLASIDEIGTYRTPVRARGALLKTADCAPIHLLPLALPPPPSVAIRKSHVPLRIAATPTR